MPHFSVALEVLWDCSWGALVGLWPAATATRGPFLRGRQQLYHAGECTKSGAKVAAVSAAVDATLLCTRAPLFVLRQLQTTKQHSSQTVGLGHWGCSGGNCRRVAPLSPHSRAHARQTIGVTLFMFSSGAPFPGIGAAGVIIEASCGSPRHICRRVAPVEKGA